MATKAKIGKGGKIERSVDGTTWTRMAEKVTFGLPVGRSTFEDVTNQDSPGDYMEFIRSLKEVEDITVSGNFTPDEFNACLADVEREGPTHYKVTLPLFDGQTSAGFSTFTAFPTITSPNIEVAAVIKLDVTLKVTGAPAWTAGA